MKLSVRIPLLFGLVILVTSASIAFVALRISSSTLENSILTAIHGENQANAELFSAKLDGQLDVLGEIATRPMLQTMNWENIQPYLVPYVPRVGALDLAVAVPQGISSYVLDNTTVDIRDRDYFRRAMAGEKNVEVVFSRLSSQIVVLFAAPIRANDEPDAPVIGVLIARKDGGRTLSNMVADLKVNIKSEINFLVDKDGTYIAHPDNSLVTNQFNPVREAEKDPSVQPLADLISTALAEKSGDSHYIHQGRMMIGHYS
jgi:methyl-accepting chemotaxis protein